VLQLVLVDAVLLRIRGRQQGEQSGRRKLGREPSSGGRETTSPENPESFSFSTPMAMAVSMAPDATA
jgi:hypothetical protein